MLIHSKELLMSSGGDKKFILPLYYDTNRSCDMCFFPSEVNASLSAFTKETIAGISGEIGLSGSSIKIINRLLLGMANTIETASFVGKEVYMGLEFAVYRYNSSMYNRIYVFDVYVSPKAIIGDLTLVKDAMYVVTSFSDSFISGKFDSVLAGFLDYTFSRSNNSSIEYIYRA